jgi:hypothetical protein
VTAIQPIALSFTTAAGRLSRRGLSGLFLAIAIAATLHITIVARSPLIAPDGIGYIRFAQELAVDPGAAIRGHAQHPGYPFLVLAMNFVTRLLIAGDAGWETAARLVCGLSGLACVPLVWLFVKRVHDLSAANVAAVLFAILPTVRQNAADALGDSSSLMLTLAALWLVCGSAGRGTWWRFLLAGVASGFAYWVRPEGLAVAMVSGASVLIVPAWRQTLGGGHRAWIGSLMLLTGALLVVLPLMAVSGKLTAKLDGKPGWRSLHQSILLSEGSQLTAPAQRLHPALAKNARVIPNPGAPTPWDDPLPSAAAAAVVRFSVSFAETLHAILLVPLFVGLPIAARRMTRPAFSVCLMLALTQIGMLLLLYRIGGYIDRRHLLPLIVVLMPSISLGILAIGHRLTEFGRRWNSARWLAPAAVALLLTVLIPRSIGLLHESHLHKLQAATWLRAHGRQADLVGSNAVEVIYHATIDGGIQPGSVLRNGFPIDFDGPLLRNTYLVVELDAHNSLPAWSTDIPGEFTSVARIVGDPKLRQRDLVIFQRGETVRSAAVFDHSGVRH